MPKIGDKILITANTGSHNYTIGRTYIICGQSGGSWQANDPASGFYGNNLTISEFKVVPNKIDLKSLEKDEKDLETEINKYKFILKYLDENEKDECEESELTAAYLIDLFESDVPNKKDELVKILNKLNNSIKIDTITYH
jgi:hypothetical protein